MKYPIGIQSFDQIRNEGCIYADKTALSTCLNRLTNRQAEGRSVLIDEYDKFILDVLDSGYTTEQNGTEIPLKVQYDATISVWICVVLSIILSAC